MRLYAQLKDSDNPIRIFLSYSHADERHRKEIEKHLGMLTRTGIISVWQDRDIKPGTEWETQLREELEAADVIMLLVSPDFVASDNCWSNEMARALERHWAGEATVVPIHIRKVAALELAPFAALPMLPRNGLAVSDFSPHAKGYELVADELVPALLEGAPLAPRAPRANWAVTLDGDVSEFTDEERCQLEREVRRAGCSLAVTVLGFAPGSICARLVGPAPAFERIRESFDRGVLREFVGRPIVEIKRVGLSDLGATLRVEARSVVGNIALDISNEIVKASAEHHPPLLKVLKVSLSAPQQISFGYDPGDGDPTEAEADDLEGRLGRYFMTALVVRGEQLNVNLSPNEKNCGLPEPLNRTEFGRDLLRQDLELKRLAASLIHPYSESGRTFWNRILEASPGSEPLSSIFRVWVTVGSASVNEETVGEEGHVTLNTHEPSVLCDLEYNQLRGVDKLAAPLNPRSAVDDACLQAFKELILPQIERDVLTGRRFGLLRQMHSAVALSAWYRRRVGTLLTGVMDSNQTAEFGLDCVQPEEHVRKEYLRLFVDGLWKAHLPWYDQVTCVMQKKELIAGGMYVDSVPRLATSKPGVHVNMRGTN